MRTPSRLEARAAAAYPGALVDRTADITSPPNEWVAVDGVLEEKTLNVHRVLVFLSALEALDADSLAKLRSDVLAWVTANVRGSWWRGLGIGLVIRDSHSETPWPAAFFEGLVDGSGARTNVLQWIVYVNEKKSRAVALHMPAFGRSTPSFNALLEEANSRGYDLSFGVRERAGVYRWARAVTDAVPPWLAPVLRAARIVAT